MKQTNFVILLILLCSFSFSQEFNFAWISDSHIGYPTADAELDSIVMLINSIPEIEFTVATGDITEKGKDSELEVANSKIEKLEMPSYVIPGNHDTRWSESGSMKFRELWGDDKFYFQLQKTYLIGLNTGKIWLGAGGHISSEDLAWLEEKIRDIPPASEILFFVHHPPNSIDNWFKVTNLIQPYKNVVLCGHGHNNRFLNSKNIPAIMGRAAIGKSKPSWGFTLVKNTRDSLFFFEIGRDTILKLWGSVAKNEIQFANYIDSTQFIKYGPEILWKHDLQTTLTASLVTGNKNIYSADMAGNINCYSLNGKKIWNYKTNEAILSRPAFSGKHLFAATNRGKIFKIDAEKGEMLQTTNLKDRITSQLVVFKEETNSQSRLLIGTGSGKLVCLDTRDLNTLWINEDASEMIETKPLVFGNKIIYGSWDARIHCLDSKSGEQLWEWTENDNFYYSPAVCQPLTDGNSVFICAPDGHVSSIDLISGKTNWRINHSAWESIGISEDRKRLFVKSTRNQLSILNAKNGELIRELNIPYGGGLMPVEPIEWKGSILFGTGNGFVYKINRNYQISPLVFTGTAGVHTLQRIHKNVFATSNVDGRLVVFKIR